MEYKHYLQSFHVEAEHRQLSKHNQHVLLRGSLTKQLSFTSSLEKVWKNIPASFNTVYLDLV